MVQKLSVVRFFRAEAMGDMRVGRWIAQLASRDVVHFHPLLRLEVLGTILTFLCLETLVPFLIRPLELQICRRTWPRENRNPVPQNIPLGEGPMTIRFPEFV